MQIVTLLLVITLPLLAAPKPLDLKDPLVVRAIKACGNLDWEAVRIRKVPGGAISFCAACVKGCGWNKVKNAAPLERIDSDDLQIGPVYFVSDLRSEPFDIDEESPFRISHVTGALGMKTHASYQTTKDGDLELLLSATRLGGTKEFERIALASTRVRCEKAKCTYEKPQCVLNRQAVDLPEERTAALGLKAWKDYPKDTLYFIDRIALMAAAGDRKMYYALTTLFPQWKTEDNSVSSLFHNSIYGNTIKTEALFEFGCGREGYERLSDDDLASVKRSLSVVGELREKGTFVGAKVEAIPPDHPFIRYGLKPGDIVTGYENMVMSLYVLRDLPSRLESGDMSIKLIREGKPMTWVIPGVGPKVPFQPTEDHLIGKIPLFFRKD